jgi:acetyl esterase/lipase
MSIEDPSTWPQYATIDPEFQATIDAMGGPQALPSLGSMPDVASLRVMMDQMVAQMAASAPPADYSGIKRTTIKIPVRDGSEIPAILYQPETAPKAGSPLVVLYHGGGFCVGTPEMEEPVALDAVRRSGAVALSIDYRMAPEFPWPVPTQDSWDALKWAASNASSLGADPSKGFIIGGTSAGAIISCVLSHQARDEGLPSPLTGVWLNVPLVVMQDVVPEKYRKIHTSATQNTAAPILDKAAIDFFMSKLVPMSLVVARMAKMNTEYYAAKPSDPHTSPLLWPGGHKGLPPHLIQVDGMDPLRDDGLIYAQVLKEEGVPVQTFVYPGVPHGFEGMFGHLSAAKKFVGDRGKWFEEQLGSQ